MTQNEYRRIQFNRSFLFFLCTNKQGAKKGSRDSISRIWNQQDVLLGHTAISNYQLSLSSCVLWLGISDVQILILGSEFLPPS